jgi:glycosyltransferase involved in cell wall biosynthesis
MKIVVISTFWNAENLVSKSIKSLKDQNYTNFVAYYIDDLSTDNSYNEALNEIGSDNRFHLIKNTEKKYKTKNFVDVIKENSRIDWDDVIVELDGDDQLIDNFVLGLINKIYDNQNIWICGSRWVDQYGKSMNYGEAKPELARSTPWNFSHLRTFRAFLFRQIQDHHLKYDGEYFKAACDLGYGMPMLEMSGNEHYYFLDQVTYIYNWHDHQSYSDKNSFKDKEVQSKTAKYIYSISPYQKLILEDDEITIEKNPHQIALSKVFVDKSSITQQRLDFEKNKKVITKTNVQNMASKSLNQSFKKFKKKNNF